MVASTAVRTARNAQESHPQAPSPERVERRLREAYGQPKHGNKRDPLGELIYIVLSSQTREAEYQRAFAALWNRYRAWDALRRADPHEAAELIRFAGLSDRKMGQIRGILSAVHADHGATSLRFLRALDDEAALAYLMTLPGVGPKTARCVMMYSLDRRVLPVDAHVWRISKRLGWVSGGRHPERQACEALEARIPAPLRASLHMTMVAHGRAVCRPKPLCKICVLADLCPSAS